MNNEHANYRAHTRDIMRPAVSCLPLIIDHDVHRHRRRRHPANCFRRSLFKVTLSMLNHDARRPAHRTTNLQAHFKLMIGPNQNWVQKLFFFLDSIFLDTASTTVPFCQKIKKLCLDYQRSLHALDAASATAPLVSDTLPRLSEFCLFLCFF